MNKTQVKYKNLFLSTMSKTLLVGFFITSLVLVKCSNSTISYKGHKVYNIKPLTNSHLEYLSSLEDDTTHINFWSLPTTPGNTILVQVNPEILALFQRQLRERYIPFAVTISDVQRKIDIEKEENYPQILFRVMGSNAFDLGQYHTLEEIYTYLDLLSADYPELAAVEVIGNTHENQEIKLIRIPATSDSKKPIIFIDAGMHAREWISPATALYIIKQLLSPTKTSAFLRETFDWYIIPVINPDGYKYSWTRDRLWRKNRAPYGKGSACIGVDLNRNFEIGKVHDVKKEPCSAIYRGKSPFSESETRSLRDLLLPVKNRLAITFSLHSFGQLWITPYMYKVAYPTNFFELNALLKNVMKEIKTTNQEEYFYGPGAKLMYSAQGVGTDWFHEVLGVEYPFIIELRDAGSHGFILPKKHIIPTSNETWAGIKYVAEYVAKVKFNKEM